MQFNYVLKKRLLDELGQRDKLLDQATKQCAPRSLSVALNYLQGEYLERGSYTKEELRNAKSLHSTQPYSAGRNWPSPLSSSLPSMPSLLWLEM